MNDKSICTKLRTNYVMDLKKPSIDKFERATILRGFLDDKGMSIRTFAKEYGFKKSTIEDWLLYTNITEEEYTEQLAKGMKPVEIYRSLRGSKGKEVEYQKEIDRFLVTVSRQMRRYILHGEYTPETRKNVHELKNELNRLLMRVEKK